MESWKRFLNEREIPEKTKEMNTNALRRELMSMFKKTGAYKQIESILGKGGTERYVQHRVESYDGTPEQFKQIKNNPAPDLMDWVGSEFKKIKKQKQVNTPPTDDPSKFDPTDHRNWRNDL